MHGSEKWRLWELSKWNKQWLSALSTISEHSKIVSSTQKNVDCVSCSKTFLRAGNNPVVLKNGAEHAEALFIALGDQIKMGVKD